MIRHLKSLWALREGLAFQIGLWTLAIGICLTLLSSLRELQRGEALKAELAVPTIDVRNVPLRKEDYLAVRERVGRAHADTHLKFIANDDSLTVKADKLDDYTSWRMALADVMLSMPGAVWSVKTLCAGEKCTEGAYSASVTALVRSFAVGPSTTTSASSGTAVTGLVGETVVAQRAAAR